MVRDDFSIKQEVEENLSEHKIEKELGVTPMTTLNPKVVWDLKNLQVSHNKHAIKMIKLVEKEKAVSENLSYLI